MLHSLAAHYGFSLDVPFKDLAEKHVQVLLLRHEGRAVRSRRAAEGEARSAARRQEDQIQRRRQSARASYRQYRKQGTSNAGMDEYLKKVMVEYDCPECGGARLKRTRRLVTIDDRNLYEVGEMHLADLLAFLKAIKPTARQRAIAETIVREVATRLELLIAIGLDYFSLNRRSATLSGGESQRIRLSSQIGSGLMGMLYVLDEPSIGLHPKDNVKMIETLKRLRDLGNTVIVVEHDADTIRAADHIIEIGPGPGAHGGRVVAQGPLQQDPEGRGLADGPVPERQEAHRDTRAPPAGQRQVARHPRRTAEQPQEHRRRDSARAVRLRHRRLGLGQELADSRHRPEASLFAAARQPSLRRRPRRAYRRRALQRRDRRRPIADRPFLALESRNLHRLLRRDPHAVRRDRPGEAARLHRFDVQLQRQRRPLRGVRRRRLDHHAALVHARRGSHLPDVQRRALQPRHARGRIPGEEHCRGPRPVGRRRRRVLRRPSPRSHARSPS